MGFAIEHILNVLSYWAETFGRDRIFVWMSNPSESNQVISPKHMVAFALPYHLMYHKKLKEMGIKRFGLHLCGDQNRNLPIWSRPISGPSEHSEFRRRSAH